MKNLSLTEKHSLRRIIADPEQRRRYIERLFEMQMGSGPNLDEPRLLSERLCALYLRKKDPLRPILARRSAQMELLRAKRQDAWLLRTWATCRRFHDVRWKDMPEKFVLRAEHLPSAGVWIDRTQKGWKKTAKETIRRWMHVNGFSSRGSIDHADIEPLVYVEEARSERMLCVLCMEGQIHAMYWSDSDRCIMDASGVLLRGEMADPPENLPEINAFCSAVSADFPFMKLELFVGSGQGKLAAVHLWEDTPFFLCAGKQLDEELGSMLKIPNA